MQLGCNNNAIEMHLELKNLPDNVFIFNLWTASDQTMPTVNNKENIKQCKYKIIEDRLRLKLFPFPPYVCNCLLFVCRIFINKTNEIYKYMKSYLTKYKLRNDVEAVYGITRGYVRKDKGQPEEFVTKERLCRGGV